MMTGNEWVAAITMIIAVVANIIACSIGILLQGPVGAAIGVSVALVVWNIAMAVYVYRRLDIVPGLFYALRNIGFRQGSVASAS
jgi:O-antigen/teichoic acid export membrane protein